MEHLVLYARSWGIDLDQITVPVHLWHGLDDATVPAAMGRYLAGRIPDCRRHFIEGEGHFSLAICRAGEFLETLHETLIAEGSKAPC